MPVPSRTVPVPIDALVLKGSPRLDGESPSHTRTLAELDVSLPPILVHRETMWVIDGVHRVQAARSRGETKIDAVFFEGDLEAAFVAAVRANVTHGLPLSTADRRAAATRILVAFPSWSDRAIAAVAGVSAGTVRALRADHQGPAVSAPRVGRDGRKRPIDAAIGRRRAAAIIAARPEASLRQIASASGVSVGTARNVRERVRNGRNPVPTSTPAVVDPSAESAPTRSSPAGGPPGPAPAPSAPRLPSTILANLRRDPSMRYTQAGRAVLRWLSARLVNPAEWSQFTDSLPAHSAYAIAEFAAGSAHVWQQIADELRDRTGHAD